MTYLALTQENFPFLNDWKPEQLISRVSANPKQKAWLKSQKSLTGCLKQHCPQLEVKVLNEAVMRPQREEAIKLGYDPSRKAWIRTVFLCCDNTPWIYARTIIPNFHPGNPWYSLKNWGKRPLGELLFQMQNLQRSEFEIAEVTLTESRKLGAQDDCFNPSFSTPKLARRSVFHHQNAPLLLTEIFLHFPEDKNLPNAN